MVAMKRKEKAPAFLAIIDTIKEMSDKTYQTCQWVARKNPRDYACYENTIMYFLEEAHAVFEGRDEGRIEMIDKQYQMLKRFYDMVDVYDSSEDRPESDAEIVVDPKWNRIREYAKLVYEELTKE